MMDYAKLNVARAEEIEQELVGITHSDFEGFAADRGYQAALLLAEIYKRFDAVERNQDVLGHQDFTHWMNAFCQKRRVSIRLLNYYTKVGRFLLSHISEDEFCRLSVRKREILADLAKAGRLTPELLQGSFDLSDDELKKKPTRYSGERCLGKSV